MLDTLTAFVVEYWSEIIAVFFAIHAVAVPIVNATPTDIDNKVLSVVHKLVVFLADIIPNTKTGKSPD